MFWSIAKSLLVVAFLLSSLPLPLRAQEAKEGWQRIYTGEDSVIDVNASSLRFDTGHILHAEFRTRLAKAEPLRNNSQSKYQTRLETIEFNLTTKRYRFIEITLLDPAGTAVQSDKANASEDWKVLKAGGMMQRLFDGVRQLPPLGEWKVVDYRFGDGPPNDTHEFKRFIGTKVRLSPDRAEVGAKACSLPGYESKLLSDKEFVGVLGVSLTALGLKANQAEMIAVKCEGGGWAPPQSLLIKLPEGGMLMLWDGVFLVLKRQH